MFKLLLALPPLISSVFAGEEVQTEKKYPLHPAWEVLIVEGLIVANSWMASQAPGAYGAGAALLFPLNGCNYSYCADLIAAESIALYNLTLDENETSKGEIFKNNMIAWHVFAATGLLFNYFIDDSDAKLGFQPIETGGGKLVINYRY